jgi:hypothetical protein
MPSEWNMFVKKIYQQGKSKDSNYEFKQALKDASKRKSEMGRSASASGVKKSRKSAKRGRRRTASMSVSMTGGRRTRKRRQRR